MAAGAACTLPAQRQTVVDDHGRAVEVCIPSADGAMAGYVDVEYSDDRFYSGGRQAGGGETPVPAAGETEAGMEGIDRKIRSLSDVMALGCNEEVKRYIDRYTKAGRQSTCCLLGRARYYDPFFEKALRSYGLPLELKYLPVIESGLDPNATSRVGAAGLWQFMAATGRQYDLRIDCYVDERRDPEKSSYAAARMLNDLYNRFGDWTLALAAYNCGPTRVSNAISKAGGAADFWAVYRYLPKETRGYVPAFIAAGYVMNFYGDYGIIPQPAGLPARCDTVLVEKDVSLARIAGVLGMAVDELKTLNPQYRQGIVRTCPGGGTARLHLPAEMAEKFRYCKEEIYEDGTPCDGTERTVAATGTERQAAPHRQGVLLH